MKAAAIWAFLRSIVGITLLYLNVGCAQYPDSWYADAATPAWLRPDPGTLAYVYGNEGETIFCPTNASSEKYREVFEEDRHKPPLRCGAIRGGLTVMIRRMINRYPDRRPVDDLYAVVTVRKTGATGVVRGGELHPLIPIGSELRCVMRNADESSPAILAREQSSGRAVELKLPVRLHVIARDDNAITSHYIVSPIDGSYPGERLALDIPDEDDYCLLLTQPLQAVNFRD